MTGLVASAAFPWTASAKQDGGLILNQYVRKAVNSMPRGKGYDASVKAVSRLAQAVTVNEKDQTIQQNLKAVGSCFCSGATYLVFLSVVEDLRRVKALSLSPKVLARYANLDVQDGEEIFGRWNANGPGTAKLFAELKCGTNFTSYQKARAGDFLKIWWTDEIGSRESGHLVVYLSQTADSVTFWSANKPGGYGTKTVAKSKIKRALFSRLTSHLRLERAGKLSRKNQFLADMLRKRFTWDDVVRECAVQEG